VSTTRIDGSGVYLNGDSEPIITTLDIDEVLARIADLSVPAHDDVAFVRLPLLDGRPDAAVRPRAIAAIIPAVIGDDEADA
jgi:hypothetical protein